MANATSATRTRGSSTSTTGAFPARNRRLRRTALRCNCRADEQLDTMLFHSWALQWTVVGRIRIQPKIIRHFYVDGYDTLITRVFATELLLHDFTDRVTSIHIDTIGCVLLACTCSITDACLLTVARTLTFCKPSSVAACLPCSPTCLHQQRTPDS